MPVPLSAGGIAGCASWATLPPGTRRAFYPNGYHLLMSDMDRQQVIDDVIAWSKTNRGGRQNNLFRILPATQL